MTFSFSEAQDAAYALGWPHVRRIEREVGEGEIDREVHAAREILRNVDPPWFPQRSDAMCLAYVRGVDVTPRADPPEAAATMARRDALEDAEIDDLVDRWLRRDRYWFQIEELVLALEALLGSDAAGTRMIAGLARRARDEPDDVGRLFGNALATSAHAMLFCLGFVALRSEATRSAIAELRDGARGATRMVADLVVDGAEGCRRHAVRHLFAASFAGDDPEYLRSLSAGERFHSSLTPRFAYLGGEPVLAHYVARARRGIPPYAALRFVAQFGTIRHPLVIELMGILASKKTPRRSALAWLREHRDFVDAHPAERDGLPESVRALLDA